MSTKNRPTLSLKKNTEEQSRGIDLQLPAYILEELIPHAQAEGLSSQAIIKRIVKEYYNL